MPTPGWALLWCCALSGRALWRVLPLRLGSHRPLGLLGLLCLPLRWGLPGRRLTWVTAGGRGLMGGVGGLAGGAGLLWALGRRGGAA